MTQNTPKHHLTLQLVFPQLMEDLHVANIRVVVEDIGEADAPARLLSRHDFTELTIPQATGTLALEIDLPDLDDALAPAVRVHVDTDGAGTIQPGHFINPSIVRVPKGLDGICRVDLVRVR